jgi:phenylpropionate dioxygenase-like ring-hydroxylating dioxygenase large terminal subunit
MENSFDNAHFAFVHKGTFGDISQPKPEKYEITETDYGFDAETIITVRNPPGADRITGTKDPTTKRHQRSKWFMPCNILRASATSYSIVQLPLPTARSRSFIALPQRHRSGLLDTGIDRLGCRDHRRGS